MESKSLSIEEADATIILMTRFIKPRNELYALSIFVVMFKNAFNFASTLIRSLTSTGPLFMPFSKQQKSFLSILLEPRDEASINHSVVIVRMKFTYVSNCPKKSSLPIFLNILLALFMPVISTNEVANLFTRFVNVSPACFAISVRDTDVVLVSTPLADVPIFAC